MRFFLLLARSIAVLGMSACALVFLILLITGVLMTAWGLPIFLLLCLGAVMCFFMWEWAGEDYEREKRDCC